MGGGEPVWPPLPPTPLCVIITCKGCSPSTLPFTVLFYNLRPAFYLQRFYRYHDHVHSKTLRQRSRFGQKRAVHALPYMRIFKKAFPQCFNVFFTFFVTLSVFPVVLSGKLLWTNGGDLCYDSRFSRMFFSRAIVTSRFLR